MVVAVLAWLAVSAETMAQRAAGVGPRMAGSETTSCLLCTGFLAFFLLVILFSCSFCTLQPRSALEKTSFFFASCF